MKRAKAELGDLEHQVMRIVWAHQPLTAEAVREHLDRDLKEATVRTVLRRLEDKAFVTHTLEDRTFIYRAAKSRQRVAAAAVKRIADWFCDGAMDEVLVGMVDAELLDQAQLDRLAKRIELAKRTRRSRIRTEKVNK